MMDHQVGSLLIGAIREIHHNEIVVSLPYNYTGTIQMEHAIDTADSTLPDMSLAKEPLHTRFQPGQLVHTVVLSKDKGHSELSIRPSLFNTGLDILNLQPGMRIPASVRHIEEHGFTLSLGFPNVTAFLKKKHATSPNSLKVGHILSVVISAVNKNSKVISVFEIGEREHGIKTLLPLDLLKPGLLIECTILSSDSSKSQKDHKKTKSITDAFLPINKENDAIEDSKITSLTLSIFDTFKGMIDGSQKHHPLLSEEQIAEVNKKTRTGQKVFARIIAVFNNSSCLHLSLLSNVLSFTPYQFPALSSASSLLSQVLPGTVIGYQSPKVARILLTVHDTESQEYIGVVHTSRLVNKEAKVPEKVSDFLSLHQKVKARVMHLNHLEGTISLSLRPCDIASKYFSQTEVSIGDVVSGIVKKVFDNSLLVSLSETVHGIAPIEHLTDYPLKEIAGRFKEGFKTKFIVIENDVAKGRLVLSAKKTLVSLTGDKIVKEFSDLFIGKICQGWFVAEVKSGFLVSFFDGMVGLLMKDHLDKYEETKKTILAQGKGALVKVRVLKMDEKNKKILLSLDLDGDKGKKTEGKKEKMGEGEEKSLFKDVVSQAMKIRGEGCGKTGVWEKEMKIMAVMKEGVMVSALVGEKNKKRKRDQDSFEDVEERKEAILVIPKEHLGETLAQGERVIEVLNALAKKGETEKIEAALSALFKGGFVTLSPYVHLNAAHYVLASLKHGLIRAARLQKLAERPDEKKKEQSEAGVKKGVSVGEYHLCYIRNITDKGIAVSFGEWGWTAFSPKNLCSVGEVSLMSKVQVGDVLLCRVSHIDSKDRNKIKVDLREHLTGEKKSVKIEAMKLSSLLNQLRIEETVLSAPISPLSVSEDHIAPLQEEIALLKEKSRQNLIFPARIIGHIRSPALHCGLLVEYSPQVHSEDSASLPSLLKSQARQAFIHITEVTDNNDANIFTDSRYAVGELLDIKILPQQKPKESLLAQGGLKAKNVAVASARVSILTNTETTQTKRPTELDLLQNGQDNVQGIIVSSSPSGIFVSLSSTLIGRIALREISKDFVDKNKLHENYKVGDKLASMYIKTVDLKKRRLDLSLRLSDRKDLLRMNALEKDALVACVVKKVLLDKGVICTVVNSDKVDVLVPHDELSDDKSVSIHSYKTGTKLLVRVTKVEAGRAWGTLRRSAIQEVRGEEEEEEEDEEMGEENEEVEEREEELMMDEDEEDEDEEDDLEMEEEGESLEEKENGMSESFLEEMETLLEGKRASKKMRKEEEKGLSTFDFGDELVFAAEGRRAEEKTSTEYALDSLLVEDEESQKKISQRQKKHERQERERELREREATLLSSETPKSVEDFERELVSGTSNSLLWIQYTSHFLSLSDLSKARDIMERSIQYLSLMTEQDKLNIFLCYLNMETAFGTHNTAQSVLERGLKYCDAKKLYMQYTLILEKNCMWKKLGEVLEKMTKLYATSKKVWIRRVTIHYQYKTQIAAKGEERAEGRNVVNQAIVALPKRKHPLFVMEIGKLEMRFGDVEKGVSFLDNLLAANVGRTDLWSQYLDLLIGFYHPKGGEGREKEKEGRDMIRGVFKRCVALPVKPRKIRFFFKKWLLYEQRHGDEEHSTQVKNIARDYVEKLTAQQTQE